MAREITIPVNVWEDNGEWYWDDSEDHGGFDRVSAKGPFKHGSVAIWDARQTYRDARGHVTITKGRPHYYG